MGLFIYDDDAEYYVRHGRRFIQELVGAQSLCRANIEEREFNRSREKMGAIQALTTAREFNRLYKNSDRTVWGHLYGPISLPFRPQGSIPYTGSEKEVRQNHLFTEWVHMWDRYKIELQNHSEVNYTHQSLNALITIGHTELFWILLCLLRHMSHQ